MREKTRESMRECLRWEEQETCAAARSEALIKTLSESGSPVTTSILRAL